jgi:pimeloyl-ACP methyl ester carboxylesterase
MLFAPMARAEESWRTLPEPRPLPPPGKDGYVEHEGARLYYRIYGAGAPVMLLHGGFADGRYWSAQVPALVRAGYQAVLVDSRGHGKSSRDERPLTYELMASDVVAVMDRLRLAKAAVVGWSDGAIIGLVMAIRDPQRLTRVFAFAANMDPSGVKSDVEQAPTFAAFLLRAKRDYARLSPTPSDFGSFQAAVEKMWDTEPNYTVADLARITTPVAIVDGDHDEAIKREHTEYLARSIPGAKLIILPGVSHFAMLQDARRFNAAMLAFLGGPAVAVAHFVQPVCSPAGAYREPC